MKSTSLINDLKVLERRRGEISEDVDRAGRDYQTAQENLIKGLATTSEVTTAHSTALALQSGLSSLDGKIEEKRAEIREAQAEEERQSTAKRVETLREDRRKCQIEYGIVRSEANDALLAAVSRLIDIGKRYADAGRKIDRLQPSKVSPQFAVDRGLVESPLQFGQPIQTAVQIVLNEEERQRAKAASREATARRQEREQRSIPSAA
jgi:hypothetical protein